MPNKIKHLAVIMDGNGRWAQRQGLIRLRGHEAGAENVRSIITSAQALDIPYLTLYALSTENFNRPGPEIEGLFRLLDRFLLTSEVEKLARNDVRLATIGDTSIFSKHLQSRLQWARDYTAANRSTQVTLALNYGGRDEILRAAIKALAGGLKPQELNCANFSAQLDTAGLPDPDLLIRTGGEQRLSNFLLWQMAYTEIYFSDILWPDFDEGELRKAVDWFYGRERRFGKTGDQIKKEDRA